MPEASTHVEVDGVYVKVSARLEPLVSLLAEGAPEEDVRLAIDRFQPGLQFSVAQLSNFLDKLFSGHGLKLDDRIATTGAWQLRSAHSSKRGGGLDSAVRCRMTLIPEATANYLARICQGFFSRTGFLLVLCCVLLAATTYLFRFGLRSLSFEVLFVSVSNASTLSLLIVAAAVVLSAIFHELGHCSAVAASGLRVGRIGFGIYWFSPALFSDVSAAWTLRRWQRVAVDAGGIYFQLVLCGGFGVGAAISNSSDVQLAFQIAIVVNAITIASALNPIMKYDGYWIISDALELPNLRRQSEQVMSDLVRSLFRLKRRHLAPINNRRFLLGYGLVSLLFSMLFLVAFAAIVRRNAQIALYFPQELWAFITSTGHSLHPGPELARLSFDLLRALPILFAPFALITAASGMAGFLGRSFAIVKPER